MSLCQKESQFHLLLLQKDKDHRIVHKVKYVGEYEKSYQIKKFLYDVQKKMISCATMIEIYNDGFIK